MKRLKETKKWPAKWIHLASLFILVSSMFAMPVGILAETTTTSSSSTEAVLASEALSNSNDPVSGTLSTSGEDRVAAVNTPKAVDDVITSVKYTNNEGGLLNWSLEPWATFRIDATLKLPNHQVKAGDTTTIAVPTDLIINSQDFEVLDGKGQVAASAKVDKDRKKIVLTYTDYVEHNSDITGNIFFYVRIDHKLVPNAKEIPINLIVENKVVQTTPPQPPVKYIGIAQPQNYPISKVGSINRDTNDPIINYTIGVNRKPTNIKNAIIRDTLQFSNAQYDRNSFIVEKGQWLWESGDWVFKNAQSVPYEIAFPSDKTFEIKLGDISENDSYRIRYNVKLNYSPKDGEKFDNKVTLNGYQIEESRAQSKVLWQIPGGRLDGYIYSIKLHKQNNNGDPLQGAQFKITRVSNNQTITHTENGQESEIFTSDANGDLIVSGLLRDNYTVTEVVAPNGYQLLKDPVSISENDFSPENSQYDVNSRVLTLTISNEKANHRQLKVTKKWNDKDNQYKNRPSSITVKLLKDGVEVEGKTLELNADNQWSGIFTELDETGTYSVEEVGVPGYISTVEATNNEDKEHIVLVNTLETIEVSGSKIWKDDNNRDGKRPKEITVNLLANGVKIDQTTVKSDKDGHWNYQFKDLPKYENGQVVDYSISEEGVPDYETSVEGYNLTNTYTPEVVSVPFTKIWKDFDNQDGVRPNFIIINLLANGKKVESRTVTATTAWTGSFDHLPKYENGREIVYTLEEEKVSDYSASIDQVNYILTNTYVPGQTHLTVTKYWDDENNKDGIRPKTIKVQLYANGQKSGDVVELSEANKWTYTFSNLPENSKGKAISYTVREVEVPQGYVVTETVQDGNSIVLTNSHKPTTPPTTQNIPKKPESPKKPGKPEKTSKSTSKKFLPETGTKIMIALEILGLFLLGVAFILIVRSSRKDI